MKIDFFFWNILSHSYLKVIMADNKLSQNLLEILNDEKYFDITIEVGYDPYAKVKALNSNIKLEKLILDYLSDEFCNLVLRYDSAGIIYDR